MIVWLPVRVQETIRSDEVLDIGTVRTRAGANRRGRGGRRGHIGDVQHRRGFALAGIGNAVKCERIADGNDPRRERRGLRGRGVGRGWRRDRRRIRGRDRCGDGRRGFRKDERVALGRNAGTLDHDGRLVAVRAVALLLRLSRGREAGDEENRDDRHVTHDLTPSKLKLEQTQETLQAN